MAEVEECSQQRVQIIVISLIVICIVSTSIAVIVVFTNKNSDSGADESGPSHQEPIYRLPAALVPRHYALELAPDIYHSAPSQFSVRGTVDIRVVCTEVTSHVVLHALGLEVSGGDRMRVTSEAGGAAMEVISWNLDKAKETLTLNLGTTLEKGQTYHIWLSFKTPLSEQFQAVYYSTYTERGETKYLAATIFLPTYARMAFPCFDEPALKAEFTLTVLRKADYVALSNMPRNSTTARKLDGEAWLADRFQKSPPMSTYLLTFTVCQFQAREANTTRGYTFRAWARPESIQQTAFALEVGTKVMPFFDDYFGIPFPLPEQEMIALPEYQYGAMEHWGLVGYRETTLLYSDALPSSEDRLRIATVIAHELGHMWFGDLLTMSWWDDAWLNEGFASYVQYLGIDHAFPAWKILDQFLTETFRLAMAIDSFEQSRPLYQPVIYLEDTLAAYDRIIYHKGASILRMVKFFLGESTFKKGIQKYVAKYQYGSATHEGLWKSLSEEAKADGIPVNVSDIMLGWTVQRNFPIVMVTRNRQGHMTVTQEHFPFLKRSEEDSYRWDIPFTFATSTTHQPGIDPSPADVIWLPRHRREATVTHSSIPSPDDDQQWLLGNIGCYGFYRVNYDDSNWRALIKQLKKNHKKIGVANRVQIIMDAWSLAEAGRLNYTLALETLAYLQKEDQYLPWRAALLELQELRHILKSNSTVFDLFCAFMQKQTASVFASFDPNASLVEDLDRRTAMLVAETACLYGLPACITVVKRKVDHWMANPSNNTIQVDLRSTFYCSALAYGKPAVWEFVFAQFLNTSLSANERSRLGLALTCTRDPEKLSRLINSTLDPSLIRGQDAIDTLVTLSSNVYARELVWQFVRDHFDIIDQRFGQTAFNMKELFSGISRSFYAPEHLQQLEQLAERYPQADAAINDALEQTTRNIRWIQTNMAPLERWLRLQVSSTATVSPGVEAIAV